MLVHLLYFGALRETLGVEQEDIVIPANSKLTDLLALLCDRGGIWETLQDPNRGLRAAIDQEFAELDDVLKDGCEVALFPPVTGG